MKTKTCTRCGVAKELHDFLMDHNKGKLHPSCKDCTNAARRANRAKKARCKSCYETIDPGDKEETAAKLCYYCALQRSANLQGRTRADYRLGRPGCIVRDGVALVPDEERQAWVEMPVKICEGCGIDQHLDICLDCISPVGSITSQRIRPLYRCKDCNEWRSYKSGCKC